MFYGLAKFSDTWVHLFVLRVVQVLDRFFNFLELGQVFPLNRVQSKELTFLFCGTAKKESYLHENAPSQVLKQRLGATGKGSIADFQTTPNPPTPPRPSPHNCLQVLPEVDSKNSWKSLLIKRLPRLIVRRQRAILHTFDGHYFSGL